MASQLRQSPVGCKNIIWSISWVRVANKCCCLLEPPHPVTCSSETKAPRPGNVTQGPGGCFAFVYFYLYVIILARIREEIK
jgi:hypothetical protein